jgi:microcystin degradation protein MlrC
MLKTPPRVAIVGFVLESNRFAPLSVREDFEKSCWEEGARISELARQPSNLPGEIRGFYEKMDSYGEWTPAPLIVIGAPPGGPTSDEVWAEFMQKAEASLCAALPVDAVYVCNHGASTADH